MPVLEERSVRTVRSSDFLFQKKTKRKGKTNAFFDKNFQAFVYFSFSFSFFCKRFPVPDRVFDDGVLKICWIVS